MQTVRSVRTIIAGACILFVVGAAGMGAFLFMRQNATASGDVEYTGTAYADTRATGPSGLPIPRYVSLKQNMVNVRRGPSTAHQVIWVFARKGLPVEIIAEYENWRRVRDSDGEEGWVYHSLLAGHRTGLVAPWREQQRMALLDRPEGGAETVAIVETGVVGDIEQCTGQWCEFTVDGYTGWIEQELLWGVYPNEHIN